MKNDIIKTNVSSWNVYSFPKNVQMTVCKASTCSLNGSGKNKDNIKKGHPIAHLIVLSYLSDL